MWTELLLFKQHKCEGSQAADPPQTMQMLSAIAQVLLQPPVLAEQSREGNAIHAGHTVIWLQLILLPDVPFPH